MSDPRTDSAATLPRAERMADLVAANLRRRIITGELDDGDELPREGELIDEFGVSRPSLREGIRILETEGLIRIRRGKIGGAVVMRPTAQNAAYHLGLGLQSRATTLDDLATARQVLEPACAALAASLDDKPRARLVAQLKERIAESEGRVGLGYEFTNTALTFHATIIDHCGNTTVTLLASALDAVWSSQERLWAEKATSEGEYPDPKYQREVIRAHRRIAGLIEKGDVDGVSKAMRTHLSKSQPYVNYGRVPIQIVGE